MNIIVAIDENWAIGYKGDLLIRISKDMKHFRKITIGQNIVMGEITFESLPNQKPLPDRTNIILTNVTNYKADDTIIFNDINDVINHAQNSDKDTFIVGGQQIYNLFIPYYKKAYITKIYHQFKADRHIMNFINDDWSLTHKSEIYTTNDGIKYQFLEYEKIVT